tara:strand:+ start:692 stop:1396 length:705 start_codon:yes stop_codon:yes gene_type:complete
MLHPVEHPIDQVVAKHLTALLLDPLHSNQPALIRPALESTKVFVLVKPEILLPILSEITSAICVVTRRKNERTVMFGPFKHIVDDEEPLRLLAYECLACLLPLCVARVDMFEFVESVLLGLADRINVKLTSQSIAVDLINSSASAVMVEQLATLLAAITETLEIELPKNALRQELDQQAEAVRSALKVVQAVVKVPELERMYPVQAFFTETVIDDVLEQYLKLGEKGPRDEMEF